MKISYIQHVAKTSLLTGLAAAFLATSATAATVSFSDTHMIGSADTNFSLGQFNTGLGTLTGVQVIVDFSTLQGSVTVTNNDVANPVTVNHFNSTFQLNRNTTLGIASAYTATLTDVVATPNWGPDAPFTVIAAGGSQTFTVDAQDVVSNYTKNITSGYFNAYKGSGTVTLVASDIQAITTTGSDYGVNSTALSASTKMTVTYTYTAVPEPGTIGLLAVAGGVILLAVRRRRA
jgi:hypothetical protein